MGTTRVCGARCHKAVHPACDCWCNGTFHGAAGARAREAFVEVMGELPMQEDDGSLFWGRAMAAATAARKEPESMLTQMVGVLIHCQHPALEGTWCKRCGSRFIDGRWQRPDLHEDLTDIFRAVTRKEHRPVGDR